MEELNPFPYIFKTQFDFEFEDIREKVEDYITRSKEYTDEQGLITPERDGGITTVVLDDFPHLWEEMEPLQGFLSECVGEYWNKLKFHDGLSKRVVRSWINKHPEGGWTGEHNHHGICIAVACYLHVPPGSGRLMIKNPMMPYKMAEPLHPSFFPMGMEWTYIDVKTNDMLLFPGWLNHKTEVNQTKEDRYIMSLNIKSE